MALEVGDLLWTFVDEENEQLGLGRILRDGVRHVLHEDRLARARRRDDEAALTEADRRDDVRHAHRNVLQALDLEPDALERIVRHEFLEGLNLQDLARILAHDFADRDDRRAALGGQRRLVPAPRLGWPRRRS